MISVSVSLPACLAMVTLCLYAPVFILFLCLFTVPTTVYCTYYCFLRCICCGFMHALLANLSISSSNSIVLTNRTDTTFSLLESQQESQQQESQQQESQQQENQPGESQPAESEPYNSDETVDNHER